MLNVLVEVILIIIYFGKHEGSYDLKFILKIKKVDFLIHKVII